MGRTLTDENEMKIIYKTAKDVFEGIYSTKYALLSLKGKVSGSPSSLKMYFDIYACMRKAKCYKMGTSASFTTFLLDNIYKDSGKLEYIKAISAVKGNYSYRESVNNAQPGLVQACIASIANCGLDLDFGEIPTASIISEGKQVLKKAKTEEIHIMSDNSERKHTIGEETPITYAIHNENGDFNSDVMELNIQPPASILNVFSRLSYKPWYAIAEFVDNSTQSYISHTEELSKLSEFGKLVVNVKYDVEQNKLTIIDNAYGMEIDRFRDAILLDSRNETQSGRNEFGMGLKTAASWFGKVWKVTSTQYGSSNRYTATVDIPKLDEYHLQNTKIFRDYVAVDSHGTEILIEQVTKKITGSRTIGKIRDLLSSMYRRDINSRNIEIWFNDEPIVFEEYPVLTNFRGKSWKKELNFYVEFSGRTYRVTGFVAIMNPGSFPKAGFALFRQDRVVIGGTDSNYKPAQIFGQAQSQKSLKLFGELNMNDFPVNQAKDGFIWDDGLEDAFIDALKDNIQEYIEIADMSIKERATEIQFSDQASSELQQDVTGVIDKAFNADGNDDNDCKSDLNLSPECNQELENHTTEGESDDLTEYIETVLNVEPTDEIVSTTRIYTIPLTPVIHVDFSVQWAHGSNKYWIEYKEASTDKYEVLINIDHPFFMPFTKEDGFQKVLEKFALAFILAERQAKLGSSKEGYIQSNVIKNYMNRYLEKLAEDK
jgi:hypothetical protein